MTLYLQWPLPVVELSSWSQREKTAGGNKGEFRLEEVRGSRNASKQRFRES